ncbi:MAG: ribosome recycling factor [Actinomycetaceae bacterium]|nr:ribosome recycling factor [Actinomycetaceae bacterium]
MIDTILQEAEEKMEKAIEVAKNDFSNIRSGRASAALFNDIKVDYYGAPTPLQQLASVAIPDARTVAITPYDRTVMQAIDKALRESDLGVNPVDDGAILRVVMPALTEERRKDYVKLAKAKAEEARVSLRSVRHKAKDSLDKVKKDGEAGEDDVKRAIDNLDSLTKKYVEVVDTLLAGKEKELLEV